MLIVSWWLSSGLYWLFQSYAPSNIVIRWGRSRRGLRWGPLVGLTGAVAYGAIMAVAVDLLHHGASGWLNLVVLTAFWNAVRFGWLIPVSAVRLLHVRHLEKKFMRAYRRAAAESAVTEPYELAR